MKNLKVILILGVLCSFAAVATIGCEKEGAMEKAGKKVDEAVDSAKKAVDE
jgi:hypothetical protein